ncbi:hypothetical protein [Campylobacter corcagiensis]|uniref:Uncharacterized protein n=1 Tax=Campylobacter corcagiensis TaxID=1448857 RepID=A0A7M1LGB9_9BACT|nr:hypothetical protein [Campylobacter corcagiensis]QOQ86926.1 hypothetical protein IMC76_06855 [Campylobacter corcagiensis]
MQTIDKFSSILDIHEWARANNNLNFEKYKKIYELLINLISWKIIQVVL